MRVRVISGLIVGAAVILILLSGREIFDVACALIAVAAVHEFFNAFAQKGFKPLRFMEWVACACILLGSIEFWDRHIWRWLLNIIFFIDIRFLLYCSLILMFCFLIFGKGRRSVADLSVTILGTFYVCFLFWYLVLLRNLRFGELAVWFVALGAVATDTFALIIGTSFGRHKLIPSISPKKTVEGAVGGALACVAVFFLYGLLFNRIAYEIPLWKYLLMGITCGLTAQIGDLAASAIKRYCGIKDFGTLMPGHGGILDRLDSVLVLSPLIYFWLL
ncbi:MAG: phosphatidate cytidylyltransferase [Clostridiales bacterium]|jgi:phosphatidate cytidylyltransferase|nr:phosphatidate cytidylyltransferase [Clostridiales bacterium]